jgi:hypothetical protein
MNQNLPVWNASIQLVAVDGRLAALAGCDRSDGERLLLQRPRHSPRSSFGRGAASGDRRSSAGLDRRDRSSSTGLPARPDHPWPVAVQGPRRPSRPNVDVHGDRPNAWRREGSSDREGAVALGVIPCAATRLDSSRTHKSGRPGKRPDFLVVAARLAPDGQNENARARCRALSTLYSISVTRSRRRG